jgi:hypothetical protein
VFDLVKPIGAGWNLLAGGRKAGLESYLWHGGQMGTPVPTVNFAAGVSLGARGPNYLCLPCRLRLPSDASLPRIAASKGFGHAPQSFSNSGEENA